MGMTTGWYSYSAADVAVNTGLVGIKSLTIVKVSIGAGDTHTAYTSDAYQVMEGTKAFTLDNQKDKGVRLNGPQFVVEAGCSLNKANFRYYWEAREP